MGFTLAWRILGKWSILIFKRVIQHLFAEAQVFRDMSGHELSATCAP